jgi:hypothetical protein
MFSWLEKACLKVVGVFLVIPNLPSQPPFSPQRNTSFIYSKSNCVTSNDTNRQIAYRGDSNALLSAAFRNGRVPRDTDTRACMVM